MSAQEFKIAKEINSLSLKRDKFFTEIREEEGRISFIQNNRNERSEQLETNQSQLKEVKAQMQSIENDIASYQAQLDKDKANLNSVITNEQLVSLEKSIKNSQKKLEALEEEGLEVLEQLESLEEDIQQAQTFLEGSAQTLSEIKEEVQNVTQGHHKEIDKLNHRIDLLIKDLSPLFKDKVQRTLDKNLPSSAFTRIQNGKCEFCKLSLSSVDITSIEDKLQLKNCSGCGRLFMPVQAAY